MTRKEVIEAVVRVVNQSQNAAPLWGVALVDYPYRLIVKQQSNGLWMVELPKYGFQYKYRGKAVKSVPKLNTVFIKNYFNTYGVPVTEAVDGGTKLILYISEEL